MASIGPPLTPLAVYAQVPFCASHCAYCTYPVTPGGLDGAGALVDALLAEGAAVLAAGAGSLAVSTIYVGGGTPSQLPAGQLRRLLSGLTALAARHTDTHAYGGAVEVTVEANPEDVDEGFLALCAAHGCNRISLGVQAFADRHLERLGRVARAADVERSLRCIERYWDGRLNVDLLSGIPGQRPEELAADIAALAARGVDHITLQQREPSAAVPARQARHAAAAHGGGDAGQRLWHAGVAQLVQRGFAQYEVTHFARGGDCSAYMLHLGSMLPVAGLGPSAEGTLPAARFAELYRMPSAAAALRVLHGPTPAYLLAAGEPARSTGIGSGKAGRHGAADPHPCFAATASTLTPLQLLHEHLLVGLRMAGAGWQRQLRRRFEPDPNAALAPLWRRWQRAGLAARDAAGGGWALSRAGLACADELAVDAALAVDDQRVTVRRWP